MALCLGRDLSAQTPRVVFPSTYPDGLPPAASPPAPLSGSTSAPGSVSTARHLANKYPERLSRASAGAGSRRSPHSRTIHGTHSPPGAACSGASGASGRAVGQFPRRNSASAQLGPLGGARRAFHRSAPAARSLPFVGNQSFRNNAAAHPVHAADSRRGHLAGRSGTGPIWHEHDRGKRHLRLSLSWQRTDATPIHARLRHQLA